MAGEPKVLDLEDTQREESWEEGYQDHTSLSSQHGLRTGLKRGLTMRELKARFPMRKFCSCESTVGLLSLGKAVSNLGFSFFVLLPSVIMQKG